MFAAVQLYREGVKSPPEWPPLVGQLWTDDYKGILVMRLWPLDWVANAQSSGRRPLASLWHPVLVRVGHDDLLLRGFEGVSAASGARRWYTQKWLCDVMAADRARNFLRPDPRFGALPEPPNIRGRAP